MMVEMMRVGCHENISFFSAAYDSIESMEKLVDMLSIRVDCQSKEMGSECSTAADVTVTKFKKLISFLGSCRTGHARFRRAPISCHVENTGHGGDVEVIEDIYGSTIYCPKPIQQLPPLPPHHQIRRDARTYSSPCSSAASLKRRCNSEDSSGICEGKCHCSKRRKLKARKTLRVPAVSMKVSDIPADDFSWRKYGQKPIKGSPHPRGYYKCSTVRGCPARKHVERAGDDPTMMIVTYEGEHNHILSSVVRSEVISTKLLLRDSS